MTNPKLLDPAAAGDAISQILAGREYTIYYEQNNGAFQELFAKIQGKVAEILEYILAKLLPNIDLPVGVSVGLAYGLLALLVCLMGFLVCYILKNIVYGRRLKRQTASLAQDFAQSIDSHLDLAEEAAGQGDFAQALRHLFLAYVLYLDQNDYLEARFWKTNGEYYAELLAQDVNLAASFYALALKFEEGFYGGKNIIHEDYLRYRRNVLGLIQRRNGDEAFSMA